MRLFSKLVIVLILFPLLSFAQKPTWDMKELYKTPKFEETDLYPKDGVKAIFYEGVAYKGKPTKVFAYYSYPLSKKPKKGYPAVVLVHGGGGTAFDTWVKLWNDKGFVAISMDLEGHVPSSRDHRNRKTFEGAGPQRVGVFHDDNMPLNQQWYYHAVAQCVKANSLLRSLKDVDKNNIGVTGISWGGMLTSTLSGVDSRFKFAIPIYGCGFLDGTDGHMGNAYKRGSQHYRENLFTNYEGAIYLPKAKMPMLFINGTNDAHFPLPATIASSKAPKANTYLYLEKGLSHGHEPGWAINESYYFANAIVNGESLIKIQNLKFDVNTKMLQAKVSKANIKKVDVIYTTDKGEWYKRSWKVEGAQIIGKIIKADLPKNVQAAYFHITDEAGITFSSEMVTSQGM